MTNIKVKLFALAKDEGAYIPQWVFHHFYFGFDEIEIWLNNIEDNSVEVCEKISQNFPNFSFRVVDDLFYSAKVNKAPFQHVAYSRFFKEEKSKNNGITHIFYLDLDEYWFSSDFQQSVHEMIKSIPTAETISCGWVNESADLTKFPFEFLENGRIQGCKNRHLKSLVRISDNVKLPHAHNTILHTPREQYFQDGTLISCNQGNANGSILDEYLFNDKQVDKFFVYHRLLRSSIEYISSLLRGDLLEANQDILKLNRYGFKNSGYLMSIEFDTVKVAQYQQDYKRFILDNKLFLNLKKSEYFVIQRFETTLRLIKENNLVNDEKYKHLFIGVNVDFFN